MFYLQFVENRIRKIEIIFSLTIIMKFKYVGTHPNTL